MPLKIFRDVVVVTCSLAFCAILGVAHHAHAGKLSDFEEDAAASHPSSEKKSPDGNKKGDQTSAGCIDSVFSDAASDCMSEACQPFTNSCITGVLHEISEGGANSTKRADPVEARLDGKAVPRKTGEALIPYFRLDISYQDVESDVTAWDYRGEIGSGAIGFQFRETLYRERQPKDELKAFQYYALYRMSFGNTTEVDLGLGALVISGNSEHGGFSITLPFLYHPSDYYGLEFRPAWSTINENTLQDYELALMGGWRYVSLKAGYRWFRSEHQSLDGPIIGLALCW